MNEKSTIKVLKECTDNNLNDLNELFKLFDKPRKLDITIVNDMLSNKETIVVVAVRDQKVVGMCTVAAYYTLTGKQGVFEHFAIDRSNQGTGLADKMFNFAVERAKKMGVTRLMWTSRPSKEKANAFYRKRLVPAPTNVYKYDLK
ncbi:GNAT family N-acetyltransferase [Candidatus Saccharibacteria bacterium]|nr:GNAT family N-acetyltransferase [Candidatus Saccharibacteria bacterium]